MLRLCDGGVLGWAPVLGPRETSKVPKDATRKPTRAAKTKAPARAKSATKTAKKTPAKTGSSAKVNKTLTKAKTKAVKLASNPLVAEVVASTLVAAAAAMRNPKQARAMAADVAEELNEMAGQAARKSGALWQLALDLARRSIDALGADDGGKPKAKGKGKTKKKGKK